VGIVLKREPNKDQSHNKNGKISLPGRKINNDAENVNLARKTFREIDINMGTDARIIMPLSGRGKPVVYTYDDKGDYSVQWGNISFMITSAQLQKIMLDFFQEKSNWYTLGASMTAPIPGGLGEFILQEFPPLGPRHASAVAAIMVNEGMLESRGKNPIELKRVQDN
jgi:hypothetical protein